MLNLLFVIVMYINVGIIIIIKYFRLEIGKHDFTAKQFHSATYCHFCGKKVSILALCLQ